MIFRNENIVIRKAHDAIFLIDISENYSEDKCHLYEINEVGAFIWDKLSGENSPEKIADLVYKAVDDEAIPYETVLKDTRDFMVQLKEMGFIGGEYA